MKLVAKCRVTNCRVTKCRSNEMSVTKCRVTNCRVTKCRYPQDVYRNFTPTPLVLFNRIPLLHEHTCNHNIILIEINISISFREIVVIVIVIVIIQIISPNPESTNSIHYCGPLSTIHCIRLYCS